MYYLLELKPDSTAPEDFLRAVWKVEGCLLLPRDLPEEEMLRKSMESRLRDCFQKGWEEKLPAEGTE